MNSVYLEDGLVGPLGLSAVPREVESHINMPGGGVIPVCYYELDRYPKEFHRTSYSLAAHCPSFTTCTSLFLFKFSKAVPSNAFWLSQTHLVTLLPK